MREQADHVPARRTPTKHPGNCLADDERHARHRHRLRTRSRSSPSLTLAPETSQSDQPDGATAGAARAAVDQRTVQARLAGRAERGGDAAGRDDAEPVRRARARSVQRSSSMESAAAKRSTARKPPKSARSASTRPGIPDGSLVGRRLRGRARASRKKKSPNRAASTGCSWSHESAAVRRRPALGRARAARTRRPVS